MKQGTKYLIAFVLIAILIALTIAGQEVKDTPRLRGMCKCITRLNISPSVYDNITIYWLFDDDINHSIIEMCLYTGYEDNKTLLECQNKSRREHEQDMHSLRE